MQAAVCGVLALFCSALDLPQGYTQKKKRWCNAWLSRKNCLALMKLDVFGVLLPVGVAAYQTVCALLVKCCLHLIGSATSVVAALEM